MEKGSTITSNYYVNNCLYPVLKEIIKQRPTSGAKSMKFLKKEVKTYLNEAGIIIIRHPPYSPDLAPSDYWLFDYIKTRLDDHADVESQKRQITKILRAIPKEEFKKTFYKYLERLQLCINNNGDYFEHLIN